MTRNSSVMGWCVCVYSAVAPLLNTHVKRGQGGGFVQANPLKGVNSSAITPGLLLLSVIAICRPRSVPGSLCSGRGGGGGGALPAQVSRVHGA